MSKFFEISYTIGAGEDQDDEMPDITPLFVQAALSDASGSEGASDHELWLDLYHGFLEDGGSKGQAIAHTRYIIFSDDYSQFGLEDSKGNRDFPIFLVHAESVLNGRIEGIHESEILIRLGQDMAECHDLISNIMGVFHHSHKAFLHGAKSVFEQMSAGDAMESVLEDLVKDPLQDILDPLITFYIASRHKDPEEVKEFTDFFSRLQALMDASNKRVEIKLLD